MEKYEKSMNVCDRKYMFGDKSIFCSSYNGQIMPKKGQQEFICFVHLRRANYPSFNVKKVSHFTIPLKICAFLTEFHFYHLYTFQFIEV